jgi:hypothetical protein
MRVTTLLTKEGKTRYYVLWTKINFKKQKISYCIGFTYCVNQLLSLIRNILLNVIELG